MVRGLEAGGVQACPKHFVCNDQEDERRGVDVRVTPRALREVYLKPFMILARDAGPGALMTSYNRVNGVRCSEDRWLLEEVVRKEWGWDPLVVSDWNGTYSTAEAVNAGLDLEMPGPGRWRGGGLLDFALTCRLVRPSVLDARVRRVLEFVKRASGLEVAEVEGSRDDPEDRRLNRRLAGAGVVLLKNEAGLLPLGREGVGSIALIGSHMKLPAITGGGSASLEQTYVVTPFDAITGVLKERHSSIEVRYAVGVPANKMLPVLDGKTGVLRRLGGSGEPGFEIRFYNSPPPPPPPPPSSGSDTAKSDPEREQGSARTVIASEYAQVFEFQLMDYWQSKPALNKDLFYATAECVFIPPETGLWEFSVAVCGTADLYLDGKLLIDNSTVQRSGTSFFGKGTAEEKSEIYLARGMEVRLRLEFGSYLTTKVKQTNAVTFGGGGARVAAALKTTREQGVEEAVRVAKEADLVVMCTGLNGEWETEGSDRQTLALPPGVDECIERILEANPRTVLVTQSGMPFDVSRWIDKCSAMLHAWYGGNEVGNGVADVLFGEVCPSGRLPISWPKRIEDCPSFLNFGSVRGRVLYGEDVYVGYRGYDKCGTEVMWPFGFGLSYARVEIEGIEVTSLEEGGKRKRLVSVDLKNVGDCQAEEVVQVYISAPDSTIQRPLRELCGFEKIGLKAGESKRVEVEIDRYAGAVWDESEERWLVEKGRYVLNVGRSSRDLPLTATFKVVEDEHWTGL